MNRLLLLTSLLTTFAYFFSAKCSLLLGIPLSMASPVWPAAGVALSAVLLADYRLLPAIFVGAIAANLLISFESGADFSTGRPILIACIIALGAAFQAWLGAFLIRKSISLPTGLEREREVLKLLLLGGPIAAITSATVGTMALTKAGFLPESEWFMSWFTWWVGDVIGIVLVTPAALIIFSPLNISRQRKWLVVLPSVLVCVAVTAVFLYARHYEHQSKLDRLNEIGIQVRQHLSQSLSVYESHLFSVAAYFSASELVTKQEFEKFTVNYLRSNKNLMALGWIPSGGVNERYQSIYMHAQKKVSHNHMIDFEKKVNQLELLDLAINSNKPLLVHEEKKSQNKDNPIFFMVLPVIDSLKQKTVIGAVFGVYNLKQLMHSQDIQALSQVNLYLQSRSNDGKLQTVYKNNEENQYASPFMGRVSLPALDKVWNLHLYPTEKYLAALKGWQAWLTLISGLFFAALVQMFLLSVTARTQVVMRLVTEKTKELQESKIRLGAILDMAPNGILTVNEQGVITSTNAELDRIFGYEENELLGCSIDMLIPQTHHEAHRYHMQEFIKSGSAKQMAIGREVFGVRKNKEVVPLEIGLSSSILHDEKLQIVATVQDISERKRNAVQQEKLVEQLTDSNEELERFAYICSHDLQEPLRMIASFSEKLEVSLKEVLRSDEKSQLYFSFLIKSAKHAQQLISDILVYSSMSRDMQKPEMVDLNNLIDTIADNIHIQLVDHHAVVKRDELPNIVGNKVQLFQLFQNLINNGLKYQVKDANPLVTISATELKDSWKFDVKDNGIGMDSQYLKQIFEVFKRLHRQDEYTGTGIGLSICKKVVDRHGGSISVESEKGVGSVFSVTLPKLLLEKNLV